VNCKNNLQQENWENRHLKFEFLENYTKNLHILQFANNIASMQIFKVFNGISLEKIQITEDLFFFQLNF